MPERQRPSRSGVRAGADVREPEAALPRQLGRDGTGAGRDADAEVRASGGSRHYTARAAVLLLVVCGLVVALAYPLQQYLSQRSQLNQLRRQNQQIQQTVQRLQQELRAWQDPNYVRIQARLRLHMVLPGEIGFTSTITPPPVGPAAQASSAQRVSPPWYDKLWASVQQTSHPAPKPPPPLAPPRPTPQHGVITAGPQ